MPYKDKEKQKEYYQKNRIKLLARAKEYALVNKENKKKADRERYLKNRDLKDKPTEKQKAAWASKKGKAPWNKGMKGGQVAWNKGMKINDWMPLESRISASNKKIGRPAHNKGIPSEVCGSKHYNWRGGVTPVNESIRKSTTYREWRTACFVREDYRCQITGEEGKLVVHHILSFYKHPDLRMDIDNGFVMKEELHKQFHSKYGYKNNTQEDLDEFRATVLHFNPSNDYIVHV